MRHKLISLMFSFLLIGVGSTIFFFEVSEYSLVDGSDITVGNMSTITNVYSLDDIDKIETSGAAIVIDEDQVGIKVDLDYNADLTKITARSFTMITDCTNSENAYLCQGSGKDSLKTLVIGYENNESHTNFKELINIFIDEARNKTILNVFDLTQPKVTVTVNSANALKIRY